MSFILNGKRIFAKKIIHLGQKGTHIIVDTIQEKSDVVTQKYYVKEQEWIQQLF
ncbi:MAG: hypothetical protein HRU07_06645 [Nitrosopumilus sp.]|nr:hypothetical protein [Nitrosopumilus sp.]NRA05819.1 hypothetical protein [Nitrosopumilus sp.]